MKYLKTFESHSISPLESIMLSLSDDHGLTMMTADEIGVHGVDLDMYMFSKHDPNQDEYDGFDDSDVEPSKFTLDLDKVSELVRTDKKLNEYNYLLFIRLYLGQEFKNQCVNLDSEEECINLVALGTSLHNFYSVSDMNKLELFDRYIGDEVGFELVVCEDPRKPSKHIDETIKIPIKVGDTVLGGRFKNKKILVKKIGKNDKGDITLNGKPLLKFRIFKDK